MQEKEIEEYWNQPSAEELLNGSKGGEPWTPREYSNDPDYSQVDSELFQYLEQVETERWTVCKHSNNHSTTTTAVAQSPQC